MPIAVGIDLGTARSAVAVYLNQKITMIPQETGKPFLPSVVSFGETDCLVGEAAEARFIVDPENTIFNIKRIIGRRSDDPVLRRHKYIVPYKIDDVEGKPKICVTFKGRKRMFDPEEISAIVLRRLIENAEIFLGHKITDAVITVPAFFTDAQRQATKDAGSIAGLNVLQILNEPTAAAIAYGLHTTVKKEKNVLIYDLGSGMFDTSILTIKQGKIFEVRATVGHTYLGGLDIDNAVTEHCVDRIFDKYDMDVREDVQVMRRLRLACSQAKFILSSEIEAVVELENIIEGVDFRTTVYRSEFEKMCDPIFKDTLNLLAEVVAESGIDRKNIDDVVLIGGCSAIPKIRKLVSKCFDGMQIATSANPEETITFGAAIEAAFLFGYRDWKIQNMLCLEVTPLCIGIETAGGIFSDVIPRNTFIPHKASYTFTTQTECQRSAVIRVYEGARALAVDNQLLGTLVLDDLQPTGVSKIEVIFEMDSSGILKVSAAETDMAGKKPVSFTLDKGRLSSEEISQRLQEAKEFEQQDSEERNRIRTMNVLQTYVNRVSKAALSSRDKISNEEKLKVQEICKELLTWLQTNPSADRNTLLEKKKDAIKLLQPYVRKLELGDIPGSDLILLPAEDDDS